ncbi:MAG: hypothetical protein HOD37_11000, partial [Bacteroidetes bacterium]|nr:hypothetical protein [Bacteroidota bacterium]
YSPELPKLIVGSTMVIPSFEILDPVYMPGREVTLLPDQGFDFEVCAGGEEMALLRQGERDENNPFSQIRSYTNFDGAQGIFSTRVFQTSHNNRFSDITENYLATSAETKQLGFLAHGEEF